MLLVVDTNILIGELLRKRGQILIQNSRLTLYVSERVLDETIYELNKRVNLILKQGKINDQDAKNLLNLADFLINFYIQKIPLSEYKHLEIQAKNRIPRDLDDWETVAVALLLKASIWTQDCDFLGCGCPTWTTETLTIFLAQN